MPKQESTVKLMDDVNKMITLFRQIPDRMLETRTETGIVFPPAEQFRSLYNELRNGQDNRPSVQCAGSLIQIHSPTVKIAIGIDAVLELLADKFNAPIPLDTGMKVTAKPPFVTDMDKIIAASLDWMQCEFGNKVLKYSDRRIEKLCQDYYRARAYSLLVHIEYLKWKESLIGYQIKTAVEAMESEKNVAIRKIHADYKQLSDTEKTKYNQLINSLRSETVTLKTILDRMNTDLQAKTEENNNIRSDIETTHTKMRDAERKAMETEIKLIESQRLLEEATMKLERFQTNTDEWVIASGGETPVWKNTFTKSIVKLPLSLEDFLQTYSLDRVDTMTGENVYLNGTKEIRLPESLGDTLGESGNSSSEGDTDSKGIKRKHEKGMRPNDLNFLDVVNASDHPLTVEEVAKEMGIDEKSVSKYATKVVAMGKVIEGHEGKKKTYSKKTK